MRVLNIEEVCHVSGGDRWGGQVQYIDGPGSQYEQTVTITGNSVGAPLALGDMVAIGAGLAAGAAVAVHIPITLLGGQVTLASIGTAMGVGAGAAGFGAAVIVVGAFYVARRVNQSGGGSGNGHPLP